MSTAEHAYRFDEPAVDEGAREHAYEETAAAAEEEEGQVRGSIKPLGRGEIPTMTPYRERDGRARVRDLLEQTGAHPLDHILPAAVFQHDGFDPVTPQQMREQQAGRARSDDTNLRTHGSASPLAHPHASVRGI